MHHAIKIALALSGAAITMNATTSLAREPTMVTRVGKQPADAGGYFFFPGNAVDDGYVYDPPAARRLIRYPNRPSRHRHHRM